MRLKTFHAPTMAEAMAEVRAALGEDAVIVSTVSARRGRGVQVTAAREQGPAAVARGEAPPAPESDRLRAAFAFHGIAAPAAARLATAATAFAEAEPQRALAAALDAAYAFAPLPLAAPRPFVLVGLPGAGKTAVAAKLAARAALAGRSVALITTDTVRAGGVDQLRAFAAVLKVQLRVAGNPDELARAVESAGSDLVVVDTPGANPFSGEEMADLDAFLGAVDAEPVLVLAAGGDACDSAEGAAAFADLGVARFVATKLDVARRLGGLIGAAEAAGVAFADISATPFIAEGLSALGPLGLARLLLKAAPAQAPARADQRVAT